MLACVCTFTRKILRKIKILSIHKFFVGNFRLCVKINATLYFPNLKVNTPSSIISQVRLAYLKSSTRFCFIKNLFDLEFDETVL